MTDLSVANLQALDASAVPGQVVNTFTAQLETSPSVYSTFFSGTPGPGIGPSNPGWVDNVATALVCSSMSNSSMYGFGGTVDGGRCSSYWQGQLDGPTGLAAGQALYDWAFPSNCTADGNTFADYQADAANWAQQLADEFTSQDTINVWINQIIGSDINWLAKLNLVFYKLHRLDAGQEQRTVAAWAAAYPQAIEQWQTYQWLPSSTYTTTSFLSQVNAAIGVGTPGHFSTVDPNTYTSWTDYGEAVESFLGGTPSNLGLTTGNSPNAHIVDPPFGGCFIAGTPLHLADGTTIAIESVAEGHTVLGQDGAVGRHTDEKVVAEAERPGTLYGFNDEEPFFTAGHPFWTREGWKALDPDAAHSENPSRPVAKLTEGDIVHRLTSTDPLSYEPIEITHISTRIAQIGETVHGLHLAGSDSYHAHGYLVAMNYPAITAQRLADGLSTLTAGERELLAEQLEALIPTLRITLGPWVEQPLRRALAGA